MSRKWALGDNRSCALSKSQALVTMSDSMESKTQQVVIPGKNGLGLWDLVAEPTQALTGALFLQRMKSV